MKGKNRIEGPVFRPGLRIPEVSDEHVLVRFHRGPILLSKPTSEDEMFGKSLFTQRQVEELVALEEVRRQLAELKDGLNPSDPSTIALKEAIVDRPVPSISQPLGHREPNEAQAHLTGIIQINRETLLAL